MCVSAPVRMAVCVRARVAQEIIGSAVTWLRVRLGLVQLPEGGGPEAGAVSFGDGTTEAGFNTDTHANDAPGSVGSHTVGGHTVPDVAAVSAEGE